MQRIDASARAISASLTFLAVMTFRSRSMASSDDVKRKRFSEKKEKRLFPASLKGRRVPSTTNQSRGVFPLSRLPTSIQVQEAWKIDGHIACHGMSKDDDDDEKLGWN